MIKYTETLEVWECPDCAFTFDACHTDTDGGYSCPHCAEIRLERENESLKDENEGLRRVNGMLEKFNAKYKGDLIDLEMRIKELESEKEQLQELWNVAYDLGVRAEIDSVTGEISRHWMEPTKRK